MKLLKIVVVAACPLLPGLPLAALAAGDAGPTPDFKEVSAIIQAHLVNENESDLNRDEVWGLLNQLHGRVSIVSQTNSTMESATNAVAALGKPILYDDSTAYLRVASVKAGLASQINAAYQVLSATNSLKGIVLDLRFADGSDYAEAATAADLFIPNEKLLLDWGKGFVGSKAKTNAITVPLTILINEHTAAAAEALAAILRSDNRAILLGAGTAGQAAMTQDFPLKDGQYLRIATAAVKLAGGETLSTEGVKPDISVAVSAEAERAYFADPFTESVPMVNFLPSLIPDTTATNGSNRVAHSRPINEAELMRERKERPGVDVEDLPLQTPANEAAQVGASDKPVVRDPVLGRALDLIKGIAAFQRQHS